VKSHFATYVLLAIIALLVLLPAYFRLVNGPAYRQKSDEVVIREAGKRFLGRPLDVKAEAQMDVEFAWLSQAAYRRKSDSETPSADNCLDADLALRNAGWKRWEDFPDNDLQARIAEYHLRIEVWSNESDKKVAAAFGGTVFGNWKDWIANLRWFIPRHDDQYTEIVKDFGPEFIKEFEKRKQRPEWKFLGEATIFATGHSLGGGLAQEFAYSLPKSIDVPRVHKVLVFDPSPVTGFYSVDETRRNYNSKNLAIDRIYERGEILAILRSFENFIYPDTATSPVIRQVRYSLFSRAPIEGHSITKLACKLHEASKATQ
jgi:hypothetical protein